MFKQFWTGLRSVTTSPSSSAVFISDNAPWELFEKSRRELSLKIKFIINDNIIMLSITKIYVNTKKNTNL